MLVLTFSESCPLLVVDIVTGFEIEMGREDKRLTGGEVQSRYDGGV
jgi:hypothetical protein